MTVIREAARMEPHSCICRPWWENLQTSLGRGSSILTHQATQAPEILQTSLGRGSSILTHQATQAPEILQTSLGQGSSILTHRATQALEILQTSLGRGSSILTHRATQAPFLRPFIRQKSQRYRKPLSNSHHRICFLEYGMYVSFVCNVLLWSTGGKRCNC